MATPNPGRAKAASRLREPFVADLLSAFGVLLVALADWATGTELGFSAFYLLPIGYATLYGHRGAGIVAAVSSGLAYPVTEVLAGREYSSIIVVVWNASIRFATYGVVVVLLQRLLRKVDRAEQLSRTDVLTGLMQGSYVRERIDAELDRSRRYEHPMSVAYLDVDDFKRVNDTLGHTAGDDVLRGIATAMKNSTRTTDACARMGGDEFLILMPETGVDAARTVVERLQQELGFRGEGADPLVTSSIGVATFLKLPSSAENVIRSVDDLMYSVKKNGKNSYAQQVLAG